MPDRVALVREVRGGHVEYLPLARLLRVPSITLDRRMLRAAARLGLETTSP